MRLALIAMMCLQKTEQLAIKGMSESIISGAGVAARIRFAGQYGLVEQFWNVAFA